MHSSLKTKTTLVTLIPILILFLVSSCFMFFAVRNNVISSSTASMHSLSSSSKYQIESWLKQRAAEVEKTASIENKAEISQQLGDRIFAGKISEITEYMNIYYGNSKGEMFAIQKPVEQFKSEGYDPRSREWYIKSSANKNETFISDPYTDAITGETVITIAKAATDGVVGGDITIKAISDGIAALPLPVSGFVVLTYGPEHKIMAYKDKQFLEKPMSSIDESLDSKFLSEINDKEMSQVSMSNLGTMYAMAVPIEGASWKLFIFENKSELFGNTYLFMLIEIAIILLVAVGAFITVSSMINKGVLAPLSQIGEFLEKLANGTANLNSQVDINTGDEIEELGNQFNIFLENQKASVENIANQIESNSKIAAENTHLIVDSISHQQVFVNDMLGSINELTENSKAIIQNTEQSINALESINSQARDGQDLVEKTHASIDEFNSSIEDTRCSISKVSEFAKEISNLSNLIKSVAEQTNLLALNAAIESARAGEHGRGFAVVADEVRNLATETSQTTDKIESTISSLMSNTDNSIKLIAKCIESCQQSIEVSREAASFMTSITSQIDEVCKMSADMANIANKQNNDIEMAESSIHGVNDSQEKLTSVLNECKNNIDEMIRNSEEFKKQFEVKE